MIIRAFTAILGTALLAGPAYSQFAEPVSVEVKIADLNLGSAAGQARLERRVRQAAGRICGAEPRTIDLRIDHQRCRGEVLSDAALKIAALKDKSAPVQVARRAQ